jgi:hypothetical protein
MSHLVRFVAFLSAVFFLADGRASADVVLDWNDTIRTVIQNDRTKTDPGWSSRAMAMMSGAMYDSLMAIDRTHDPFHVDVLAGGPASKEAALNQAAWRVLSSAYPGQASIYDAALTTRMDAIADGAEKSAGIALGNAVADHYITWRAADGAGNSVPYLPGSGPGQWRPDPLNPTQQAWGPAWGTVQPFAMTGGSQFAPPPVPAMTSQQYTDAFNEAKSLGALDSTTRTQEQTDVAYFWAYDRAGMGPPPVIYNRHVGEIATQAGNTMEENARLYAMTMTAAADASVAAWDSKYADDFWRPITAIREADTDGNPDTEADADWVPLGAPADPGAQDFTPPFPAYVSGHATFGGAVFTTIGHFYGSDEMNYALSSDEMPGMVRQFSSFSQASEENGRSRIYLGIHWNFDDEQGRILGGQIADYVAANHFAAVPEPNAAVLVLAGVAAIALALRWRRRTANEA